MRFVLDAQPLAIKTIHALRYINVLTVKKNMHRITKNAVFTNESILEYHSMYLFLKLVQFIKKPHGQRVMNYAGTTKAPIQCTSVCTQTDVSWVGAQPVTRNQRPAASVTIRPVPSVSWSVGTTTRVADVKKTVAPAKSSSPKKVPKSSKPFSPKVCLDHESDAAYFTVKTHKGKSKENSPVTMQCAHLPHKVQIIYFEQRTTEEIISSFRFST